MDQPFSATEFVAIAARVLLGLAVAYLVYRFVRRMLSPPTGLRAGPARLTVVSFGRFAQ